MMTGTNQSGSLLCGGGVSPSKALWVCVAAPTCQYSRPTARGQSRPSQTEKVGCSWLSEGGDTRLKLVKFFFF